MSGLATLTRHSARRWRGFLAAMSSVLVVFQLFMIVAARGIEQSGQFSQLGALMPAFMREWTNMMAASFQGFVLFGYSHPLVQLFLVATAIAIGTEPAGEIESRFIDLLLSRPLPRSAAVNRTVLMLLLAILGALLSMVAATSLGLRMLAPPTATPPAPRVIVSLAVNLGLMVLAWGGIALMVASSSKRRSTAAAICGFLAFAAFVLDFVGRMWQPVSTISRVSPFHYFSPFAMIGGQPLVASDVIVLAVTFLASVAIAHVAYARRDL